MKTQIQKTQASSKSNSVKVSDRNSFRTINPLLHLQQQLGNHAIQRLLRSDVMQRLQSDNDEDQQQCISAPGIPNTNCGAYTRNRSWLPSAYVNNATCACSHTPNSPTASCVRKFLQQRLAATPASVRTIAKRIKYLDNPITYTSYQAAVQAFLTPRIYKDHVDAYRSCCCPSGPASYPAWIGVTSVPLPCDAVGASIRYFGSCHGTPGRW